MKFGHPTSTKPTPPQHRERSAEPLPGTTPKHLADIVIGRDCRWPVGESVTTMCGCPADPANLDGRGKPRYCPTHAKMSGIRLEPIVKGTGKLLKVDMKSPMTSSVDPEWESA